MGFAVAERAAARGARVTLVAGPVALATPRGVDRVDVRGALAMRAALWEAVGPDLSRTDALVMAAAVADHRPATASATKIKKGDAGAAIALVRNPDLLAEVGAARAGTRPGARRVRGGDRRARCAGRLREKEAGRQARRFRSSPTRRASPSGGTTTGRRSSRTPAAEPMPTMTKAALADVRARPGPRATGARGQVAPAPRRAARARWHGRGPGRPPRSRGPRRRRASAPRRRRRRRPRSPGSS